MRVSCASVAAVRFGRRCDCCIDLGLPLCGRCVTHHENENRLAFALVNPS